MRKSSLHVLLDRTHRNSLESSNFGVLQAFEASEHEDIAGTLGQLAQCVSKLRDTFPA